MVGQGPALEPGQHEWLHAHAHEPNPAPPGADPSITLQCPDGRSIGITVADLNRLPQRSVSRCYIVSTGHGVSGPFTFGGVTLVDLLANFVTSAWDYVDVVSADGFGNRVAAKEIRPEVVRPILLATTIDGAPLTREAGLVRLIVPQETDDALRQVKWVAQLQVA